MLDVIEKLLVLQSHDQKILKTQEELSGVGPQRQAANSKISGSTQALENAKTQLKQLESERKRLELDVEAKQELIRKYATQQSQTKKNEEYKAFASQIETCKKEISGIEDVELGVMEQIDSAKVAVTKATDVAKADKTVLDGMLAKLSERESVLKSELAALQAKRPEYAAAVSDESALSRYDRLFKNKAGRALVGVVHSACGGCHMKLPTQVIVGCQGQQEIVSCPNCGRILYYTRDMDLTVSD
ncbi:MAG TPA: C4-type zinc ribbon domain-containing protein [Verrucomicrobiae bacterium]